MDGRESSPEDRVGFRKVRTQHSSSARKVITAKLRLAKRQLCVAP